MKRDQRRRTSRINRDAWTLKTEIIRKPATQKTARGSGRDIWIEIQERITGFVLIVVVHPAHKDASVLTDLFGRPSRAFDRFPTNFEQQSLLRINPGCFAWRDAKKLRVHQINVVQENATPRVHPAGDFGIIIVKRVHVPTIIRNVADFVGLINQRFPEQLRRRCVAWKTAGHRNDSDRLVLIRAGLCFGELLF